MKSWPDVAYNLIEFIKKPSGLAVFLILSVLMLALYFYPLYMVNEGFTRHTDRMVAAIREHCNQPHATKETIRISEVKQEKP